MLEDCLKRRVERHLNVVQACGFQGSRISGSQRRTQSHVGLEIFQFWSANMTKQTNKEMDRPTCWPVDAKFHELNISALFVYKMSQQPKTVPRLGVLAWSWQPWNVQVTVKPVQVDSGLHWHSSARFKFKLMSSSCVHHFKCSNLKVLRIYIQAQGEPIFKLEKLFQHELEPQTFSCSIWTYLSSVKLKGATLQLKYLAKLKPWICTSSSTLGVPRVGLRLIHNRKVTRIRTCVSQRSKWIHIHQ